MEKASYLTAPSSKRIGAIVVDMILVFFIWYLMTIPDLSRVDGLLETLDPDSAGAADIFAEAIFKMVTAFVLKFLLSNALYFCLLPAIIGRGKTLGKLLFRLSMVSRITLKEISPSRLVLREVVIRTLFETLLVVPFIISMIMALKCKDALHDIWAKTAVVTDSSYLGEA